MSGHINTKTMNKIIPKINSSLKNARILINMPKKFYLNNRIKRLNLTIEKLTDKYIRIEENWKANDIKAKIIKLNRKRAKFNDKKIQIIRSEFRNQFYQAISIKHISRRLTVGPYIGRMKTRIGFNELTGKTYQDYGVGDAIKKIQYKIKWGKFFANPIFNRFYNFKGSLNWVGVNSKESRRSSTYFNFPGFGLIKNSYKENSSV